MKKVVNYWKIKMNINRKDWKSRKAKVKQPLGQPDGEHVCLK